MSAVMLSGTFFTVILSVTILSVVMLDVVMLSVVTPTFAPLLDS
jgi:hypothetical protein